VSHLAASRLPSLLKERLTSRNSSAGVVVEALKEAFVALEKLWLDENREGFSKMGVDGVTLVDSGGGVTAPPHPNHLATMGAEAKKRVPFDQNARSVMTMGSCVMLSLIRKVWPRSAS
jgi:hypothetical protein